MKRFFVLFAILAVCVGVANAQPPYIYENNNEIGIYTDPNPTAENAQALASYMGAPGSFTAYVVLTNPFNQHTGTPIGQVGGFEFRLNLPASVFILGNVLPPASTNFASPPNFFVGSNIPVVNSHCTLVTLTLGEFTGVGGPVYMAPVPEIASVPGNIAITDAADGFSISVAHPVSGDFAMPVFGIFTGVVPTEDASWGELKTLFR